MRDPSFLLTEWIFSCTLALVAVSARWCVPAVLSAQMAESKDAPKREAGLEGKAPKPEELADPECRAKAHTAHGNRDNLAIMVVLYSYHRIF